MITSQHRWILVFGLAPSGPQKDGSKHLVPVLSGFSLCLATKMIARPAKHLAIPAKTIQTQHESISEAGRHT